MITFVTLIHKKHDRCDVIARKHKCMSVSCPLQHGEWRSPAVRIRVVPAYRPVCAREPEVVEARNGEAAVRTHIHKKTLLPSLQRPRPLQLQSPPTSAQPRLNLNPIPKSHHEKHWGAFQVQILTPVPLHLILRPLLSPQVRSLLTASCHSLRGTRARAWGWAHSIRGEAGDAAPMLKVVLHPEPHAPDWGSDHVLTVPCGIA